MIEFARNGSDILLVYTPEDSDGEWLNQKLQEKMQHTFNKTFTVTKEMHYDDPGFSTEKFDSESSIFKIGVISKNYYIIEKEVLGIDYDLRIHESIELHKTKFVAVRNISIFGRINKFGLEKLTIGGDDPDALPKEVFDKLLKEFPNSYEMDRYAEARVSSIIRDSLPISIDYEAKFRKYLNKKKSRKGSQPKEILREYESNKFLALIDKIEEMLNGTYSYSEDQWQDEILQIVQLLYPKYINAFKEAPVRDSLANKNRRIDYLMVDASGYVDAIEIKKPFSECIVTSNRYRDNHVPMRELNGTVM